MRNMKPGIIHIVDGKRREYFINIEDIIMVKACQNYTDWYLANSSRYKAIRIQVGQLWDKIDKVIVPHTLIRIDRSTIINLSQVQFIDSKVGIIHLRNKDAYIKTKIAKVAGKLLKEKMNQFMVDYKQETNFLKE